MCPCGCGGEVKSGNTWIRGHNTIPEYRRAQARIRGD